MQVGKEGTRFTVNGIAVEPAGFVGRDGFKFVNHIAAWARGKGQHHLDNAKRYIEHAIVSLGCKWMRAPTELEFWGPPYFDHPNYHNEIGLWDLHSDVGSAFRIPEIQKKIIRTYVRLAREFDIAIQIPWLWTIKGRGDNDPRRDVSVWNEHLIANVGTYLHTLQAFGDGAGTTRVDPGPLNILSSIANEYRVHADEFSRATLANMARRWKTRDNPGELISISQSQPKHEYYPWVDDGPHGMSHVELHPKRDGEWWKTGAELKDKFGQHLVNLDESMLYMTMQDWDDWTGVIPKWTGLATKDLSRYMAMHEDFWDHGLYSCFHDFEGMGAGWHGGYQASRLDEEIAARLGGFIPTERTMVLVNAYSEAETSQEAVDLVRDISADGIARDIFWDLSNHQLDAAIAQVKKERRLWWLFRMCGHTPTRPDKPTTEDYSAQGHKMGQALIRNGPPNNLSFAFGIEGSTEKDDPIDYAANVNAGAIALRWHVPHAQIAATTVQSLDSKERKEWVRRVSELLLPDIDIDAHTYRWDPGPVDGFASRQAEWQWFVSAVGDRRICNAETGWHSAEDRTGICKWGWFGEFLAWLFGIKCKRKLNEEQIAAFLIEEIQWHERYDALYFGIYQAFSGPNGNEPLDNFGLLDRDFKLRERGKILREFLEAR